jgi:hypothetical protein
LINTAGKSGVAAYPLLDSAKESLWTLLSSSCPRRMPACAESLRFHVEEDSVVIVAR